MAHTEAPRIWTLHRLGRVAAHEVLYPPGPQDIAQVIADQGLLGLRKVRLWGRLEPVGKRDWRFEGQLGATAVQPCAVTLAPVTTRVDVPVIRFYTAEYADPDEAEAEIPEDDAVEPLPDRLDLLELLGEALALALPDFPRAPGADFEGLEARPPGAAPMDMDRQTPFQALAALKRSDPE